ncbi:argininosuccinate lyase (plasmid) [Sulfuriferula nivalis]|uniref:Argininosuccinate lyase n=2 Tax=Sulfuriferula nivalis TaxID=2675298 RepID=A0A809RP08_9PROT|nr:ATP-grasp domain-containing protein [Sulfuriferula nivalis]BBP02514.1 argininosuccinate lyase [Sulfuriferula nivalis]
MKIKKFIFVESNTSGTGRLFIQSAEDFGFNPVVLAESPEKYDGKFPEGTQIHQVNTGSVQALLTWIDENAPEGIAGVYSSSDYFVGMAAELANILNLPSGSSTAIADCRQKYVQRQKLSAAGLLMPISILVNSQHEIEMAYKKAGPNVVIKPQSGSGSFGVRFSDNLADTIAWAKSLLAQGHNERGQPIGGVLIEAYLTGKEYSVEAFDGQPIVVTEKHLSEMPFFVEIGHDMPAAVPDDVKEKLMKCAQAAIAALGLQWGPTHVELRMTSRGPVIIEVNPRLAGGFIPALIKICTGNDLVSATIAKAARYEVKLQIGLTSHAGIRFFMIPDCGKLISISNWEALYNQPFLVDAQLYAHVGDKRQVHNDFRDRIGHVIAAGDSRIKILHALKEACSIPDFIWEPLNG